MRRIRLDSAFSTRACEYCQCSEMALVSVLADKGPEQVEAVNWLLRE